MEDCSHEEVCYDFMMWLSETGEAVKRGDKYYMEHPMITVEFLYCPFCGKQLGKGGG